MNRRQRQAEAARERKALNRATVIRLTYNYLAHAAAPTATGITLYLPDGSATFVSAEDARAFHGAETPGETARRSARGGRA